MTSMRRWEVSPFAAMSPEMMKKGTARISSYYSEATAVLISVAAGAGFSILPTPLLDGYLPQNVPAIPIEGEDAYFDMFISWRKNNSNPAAAKFLAVLQELYPEVDIHNC